MHQTICATTLWPARSPPPPPQRPSQAPTLSPSLPHRITPRRPPSSETRSFFICQGAVMFASPRAVVHNVHFLLFCRRHFYENSWDDSSALKCLQFVRFGGGLQKHMWGTDKHVAFSLNGSSEFHLCNQQLSWIPRLYSLKIFCKTNLETQVMMSTPQAPNCKGAFLIFHILRHSDLTRHYRLKLNVFNWENRQGARGLFARSEWGVPLIEI